MSANDMYRIAAQVQETAGFGFDLPGERFGPLRGVAFEYPSILRRVGARMVDAAIEGVGIVLILCAVVLMDLVTGGDPGGARTGDTGGAGGAQLGSGTLLIFLAASVVFMWLYNVAQETSAAQATLGKRLLGLKVTTPSGGRIGVPAATIRVLVKSLPGVHALIGLVGLIANIVCLAMNSTENRTLHDLMAGTVVVKA